MKKIKKKIAQIAMAVLLGTTGFSSLLPNEAFAASHTMTVQFPSSTSQSQSKTITIPSLSSIANVSVDNGNVNYSVSGNQVTLNVSNGTATPEQTGGSYTPAQTKYVSDQTSQYYSDAEGYSGTLSQYVYSGSYTAGQSKWITDYSSPNYSDSQGYSGTLTQYLVSGSYTPAQTDTASSSWSDTFKNESSGFSNGQTVYSGYTTPNGYPYGDVTITFSNASWSLLSTMYDWGTFNFIALSSSSYNLDISSPNINQTELTNYFSEQGYSNISYSNWQWTGSIENGSWTGMDGQSYTMGRPFSVQLNGYEYQETGTMNMTDQVSASDTRVYAYQGYVYKPAIDTRVWRYEGYVTKPAVDTRTYTNYYAYNVTLTYQAQPNPPMISQTGSTGWNTEPVTVTLTDPNNPNNTGDQIQYSLSGASNQSWTNYSSPLVINTDGITTVSARVIDSSGDISNVVTEDIHVDQLPPTLNVTANTTDLTYPSVTLTATANDVGSGVYGIQLPNGNWVSATTTTYVASNNGTYTFVAEDNVGHTTTVNYTVSNIKKNILITNNPNVLLDLHAEDTMSGVANMRFQNESSGWSAWQSYASQTNWRLSNGDGVKTVWAEFEDTVGNISSPVEDIILLDTTPPTINSFSINDGATYTNNQNVTLSLSATDNLTGDKNIYLSNDGTNWTKMPYSTSVNWTLAMGDGYGTRTVYLKVQDVAGNISSASTASIYLDTIPPTMSLQIDGGAQVTQTRDVTLTLTFGDVGSGVKEIKIFNDGTEYDINNPTSSPITIPWTLGQGVVQTVTAVAIDNAGNVSGTASATIIVNPLTIQDFVLENVVNPTVFTTTSPFTPLTWTFAPQPMLAGANFTFAADLNTPVDASMVTDTVTYQVAVVGNNGYDQVFTGAMAKDVNHYTQTITLPQDAPQGAKVYVEVTANRKLLVPPYDAQTVYFPGPDSTEQAQVGTITGNIYQLVKFNETR